MNAVKRQFAWQLKVGCINDTLKAEKPLPPQLSSDFNQGEGVQAKEFELTENKITISDLNILASVPTAYLDKMANKESYQNRIAALYEQSLNEYIIHTTLGQHQGPKPGANHRSLAADAKLNVEMAQPGPVPQPDNADEIGWNPRANNGNHLNLRI